MARSALMGAVNLQELIASGTVLSPQAHVAACPAKPLPSPSGRSNQDVLNQLRELMLLLNTSALKRRVEEVGAELVRPEWARTRLVVSVIARTGTEIALGRLWFDPDETADRVAGSL